MRTKKQKFQDAETAITHGVIIMKASVTIPIPRNMKGVIVNTNEKIPFNEWSKERIKKGAKECTSRHKRYTKDTRVTWISPKLPFWFIRTYLWKAEGADSPEELQEVVDKIYGRLVQDTEEFYVHFGDFKDATEKEL